MEISRMLADLRAERNRIDRAITALEALNPSASSDVAEDRAHPTPTAAQLATKSPRAGGRGISAAGRKRISETAKKMWAERKKANIPNRRPMSAATKRRLSQLAKARWAAKKKMAKAM